MLGQMRRGNIAVCALVAIATFGAGSAQAAKPLHNLSRAQLSLLSAINSARAAAGVAPLRAERVADERARAGRAARWHAPATSTTPRPTARRSSSGCSASAGAAPPPARISRSPERPATPCAMWLQSPGHRENLLRPSFRSVGLGLARGVWNGREALYVTADFGS